MIKKILSWSLASLSSVRGKSRRASPSVEEWETPESADRDPRDQALDFVDGAAPALETPGRNRRGEAPDFPVDPAPEIPGWEPPGQEPDFPEPGRSADSQSNSVKRSRRLAFAISEENGIIRVMAFRGNEVLAWRTVDPSEQPDPPDLEPVGPEEKASRCLQRVLAELGMGPSLLWNLLAKVGIYRARVLIDFPLYSTLMRRLQIPKVSKRYLEPVVVSEVLEAIPFDQNEVDIAWDLSETDDEQWVFAVAVPKEKIDRQVELVAGAGAVPTAAYAQALALGLASGQPDVLVAHLDPSQASVVLVRGNVPQIVHQLNLSNTRLTVEDQAEAVSRAVDQVASYQQPIDLRGTQGPLPVVLTGQMSEGTPLAQELLRIFQREVIPFAPPLNYPEQLPLHEYAANLGLLLADLNRVNGKRNVAGPANRSLNLLPARHLPRPIPVFPLAIFVTLMLIAVHPFDIGAHVDGKVLEAKILSLQLESLRAQQRDQQILVSDTRNNQRLLSTAQEQKVGLETRLNILEDHLNTLLVRLEVMTGSALPPRVQVFSLAPEGPGFAIAGTADTYERALEYVANLRASGLFTDARLLRAEGSTGAGEGPANPIEAAFPEEEAEQAGVSFQVEVSTPEGLLAQTEKTDSDS